MRHFGILVSALLLIAAPAWGADDQARTGPSTGAPHVGQALSVQRKDKGSPSHYETSEGIPVLFVPVQPGTYHAGANTDNYGRPIQPRSLE
jgi:hypothetical protein